MSNWEVPACIFIGSVIGGIIVRSIESRRRRARERMKVKRFALNVIGDFYVADGMCITCEAPQHEAPDLMANTGAHCYFKRQPTNAEELQRAIMAVAVGCCGAVRYAGTDPAVLSELKKFNATDTCDNPLTRRN